MRIVEQFSLIVSKDEVNVYDSRHAIEEFKRWYPKLRILALKRTILQGLVKINKKIGNYMLISKTFGYRVPIEIRRDRKTNEIIGVVPTVLNSTEVINTRNELEIIVEKNVYDKRQLIEGFNYYTQHGKVFADFDEIEVD